MGKARQIVCFVKQFDADGSLSGELRMVGLFTSTAYTRSPRDIPLVRRKIASVVANSGFSQTSHSGKGLLHVLENFPRDELFQMDAETLGDMARGILRLEERPRIRLFVRRDKFNRFVSAFVYLPRDRYNTDVRIRVGERIAEAYGGRVTRFVPSFGEATLVDSAGELSEFDQLVLTYGADVCAIEMAKSRAIAGQSRTSTWGSSNRIR